MLKEVILDLLMLFAILQPYNVCLGAGALDATSTSSVLASSHHKSQPTHQLQHIQHLQSQQYSGHGSSSSSSSSSSNNIPHHYPSSSLHHHPPHQHQHLHAGSHSYMGGGGHGSSHIEQKNSYNLLSEAMSQAVSHEFSKSLTIINLENLFLKLGS